MQKKYKSARRVKKMEQTYGITSSQAKQLAMRGLSKTKLRKLYQRAPGDFDKDIKQKGISKPLREKLVHHLSSHT